MILQDIINTENPKKNEKFSSFLSSYKKTGIGHRCVYNNRNTYMKYTEELPLLKNMFVLSPYNKKETFDWYIPPNSFNLILGLKIDSFNKGVFGLKAKAIPIKDYE